MAYRKAGLLLGAGVLMNAVAPAEAAEAQRDRFGTLDDGTVIEAVTLTNESGVSARIMTLGAALQSLRAPDREGHSEDIVLGYDAPSEYLANPQYFGATVGRYANRIAGGKFTLDGKSYTLATNNAPNHLHGGPQGFDKRVWTIRSVEEGPTASVTLVYRSADGEEGYPGNLEVTATYALDEENRLTIDYRGVTDAPTVVSLTNHSYFNLGGTRAPKGALDHILTIHAERFTSVDTTLIPTGELSPVAGTPFDFRRPAVIGARIGDGDEQLRIGRGYDHNFVIDGKPGELRPALRVEDSASGRVMELLTTAPGVQFYSGNFVNGIGKGGVAYRPRDGICFEPQAFPDSPNQLGFPSARLDPGQTYRHTIVLRFSTAPN